jgi:hypothetical protein
MVNNVICIADECTAQLPPGKTKYCSQKCYRRESMRMYRAKKAGKEYTPPKKAVNAPKSATVRRGALYNKFKDEGYALDLINENIQQQEVADALSCSTAHVSRMLAAYREDLEKDIQAKDWEVSDDAKQSLEDFVNFRDRYFLTEQGIKFDTADFHNKWIKSINKALLEGGQQMILSPPRHGKTELLIHFVVWLICRNPNIRIMWVGGNEDIADHSSTMQPASRNNTKNWWTTTLGSRKEEHTAMVIIGSRQHPDDLYSALLENEAWETIVEEAHDSMCTKSELEEEEHVDCMLWSDKRTFKWLMNRKRDSMTTGGLKNFEMVYLNKAFSQAARLFNPEMIAECYVPSMNIGTVPNGSYLVAGLDPAATGYQAGFLWAVETVNHEIKLTMVDLDNHLGGGLDEAFELIRRWHEMYNCYHWVIEENGFQKAIRQDKTIKEYCNVQGIKLEGHETHKNKWDERFGVTSLAPMFNEGMIELPFADGEAQDKTTLYTKQLTYFASKGKGGRGYKSDIVMASWFPMKVIRTLTKLTYADIGIDYTPSFDGYNSIQWDDIPWR